ncbi:hypothetical protein ABW20_dc0107509 [Dactylellina cionopaga]|nr:hypothetical protein ABW20_dc0107509 [Dactylellina cionopaga]
MEQAQPTEPSVDLTIETSACWKQGRQVFETNVKKKNTDPDLLVKFFAGTYELQQTISICNTLKGVQERVNERYTTRNAAGIGNLLTTLDTVKSVGDVLLSSAPECVSAVWCAVGMVLQVVSDDIVTCQMIAEACDRIATIILATLLYESRYQLSESEDNVEGIRNLAALEFDILQKLPALICKILEFTWHIQYHIDPTWYKRDGSEGVPSNEVDLTKPETADGRVKERYKDAKEKAKKFGREAGEKLKKKATEVKNSLKEAFTSDLKTMFDEILQAYQELNATTSLAFQEKVLESLESLPEEVQRELKNLEGMLDESLKKLDVKFDFIQATADEIKATTSETASVVTTLAIDIGEVKAVLSEINLSAKDLSTFETFQRYINCFSGSLEHEGVIQGLFHKKKEDGATMEKSWFLKLDAYKDWKSQSTSTSKLLCLKAKRGHGKTMTLLSAVEDLDLLFTENDVAGQAVLLRFFFKLGDAGLQSSMRALESLLRQLLKRVSAKRDPEEVRLVDRLLEKNGIQRIEAEMQSSVDQVNASADAPKPETKTPGLICNIISDLAKELNLRLYIILDALDECEDRKSLNFMGSLRELAYSSSTTTRILFSTRDEGNIENDFQENNLVAVVRGNSALNLDIPYVEVVELTKENNAAELHDYLKIKLRPLVERRDGKSRKKLGDGKLDQLIELGLQEKASELAETIKSKVDGDFAYASMVVANLQQPSKKTLKRRIKDLPSDIGEIYRKRLDLLTAEERLLVLFALKWVVWSVSDVTPIEIAEHFREVYWEENHEPESESESESEQVPAASTTPGNGLGGYNPSEDPEIREIVSHLRHAGHDFFSFNADIDPVVVHLSIREWIRGSSKIPKLLENAQAQVTNSLGGELVFQFKILSISPPS